MRLKIRLAVYVARRSCSAKVLSVNVKAGDAVKSGDVLLILEAMKMQNEIMAPAQYRML